MGGLTPPLPSAQDPGTYVAQARGKGPGGKGIQCVSYKYGKCEI